MTPIFNERILYSNLSNRYIPDYQSLQDYRFFKKDQINYALRRFAPGELLDRVGYMRMESGAMKLLQKAKGTIVCIIINCETISNCLL